MLSQAVADAIHRLYVHPGISKPTDPDTPARQELAIRLQTNRLFKFRRTEDIEESTMLKAANYEQESDYLAVALKFWVAAEGTMKIATRLAGRLASHGMMQVD